MKIVLITGSYPPDICGVADYTERLSEALQEAGAEVVVFTGKQWKLANAAQLSQEIGRVNADVTHMQYPATGYGWNLGPQLLSLLRPLVMTIHECSQSHVLRRLSLYPFAMRSRQIIFTNQYEREYSERFAPWIEGRSTVIPIGSNVQPQPGTVNRLNNVVTHFGLIRPHKGLEQIMEMGRLFKQRANGLRLRVVGTVLPGSESYFGRLRAEAEGCPVDWVLGLNGKSLSRALAQAEVAYLPYPDGASERRSSLIAMLANRTAIITTRGSHTPPAMESAIELAGSPIEAVKLAECMFKNPEYLISRQLSAAEYARRFAWNSIATEHMTIYRRLADRKA
jgi:glycosyltransferase involved in cell wall biosynthesis